MKNILIVIMAIGMAVVIYWVYSGNQCGVNTLSSASQASSALIVGTNAEFAPFCFIQDGEIVGFDIDVVREVAKRLDKKLDIKDYPFEALLPQIQTGSVQVLAAGMTATPERAERVLFTKPYIGEDPLVIVTKDPGIQTIDDLKGKQVVVNDGYTADAYISALPDVHVLRLKTPVDAIMALQHGRADAFVAARNTIDPIIHAAYKDLFKVHVIPNTSENCALAISKKQPELLGPIQHALDAMQQDGTLNKIKTKWGIRS